MVSSAACTHSDGDREQTTESRAHDATAAHAGDPAHQEQHRSGQEADPERAQGQEGQVQRPAAAPGKRLAPRRSLCRRAHHQRCAGRPGHRWRARDGDRHAGRDSGGRPLRRPDAGSPPAHRLGGRPERRVYVAGALFPMADVWDTPQPGHRHPRAYWSCTSRWWRLVKAHTFVKQALFPQRAVQHLQGCIRSASAVTRHALSAAPRGRDAPPRGERHAPLAAAGDVSLGRQLRVRPPSTGGSRCWLDPAARSRSYPPEPEWKAQ